MLEDFGGEITGYLVGAEIYGYCVVGQVYADQAGRFREGALIRTSNLVGADFIHGLIVIQTLNSRYVICDRQFDEVLGIPLRLQ